MARMKYPMEQRPQVIRTNERTDINFTFSLPDQPLENSQVKPLWDTLKKSLRRARLDMRFMEAQERRRGSSEVFLMKATLDWGKGTLEIDYMVLHKIVICAVCLKKLLCDQRKIGGIITKV